MYQIYFHDTVIGSAEIVREGLYYRISCICTPRDDGIHRIFVSDGENTADLGICVPNGNHFSLKKQLPIKHLPGSEFTFTLVPNNPGIPVRSNTPFPELDKLDTAKFQISNGQAVILTEPAPTLQDSDPTPESPRI